MPMYWSSSWGTRLAPIRQLGWARAPQDHCYLHRKPLQAILTSENKYSTDTLAMDAHGNSLGPTGIYFPRLQTARPTLEFFHPRAGPGSNLSTHIWRWSVRWELAPCWPLRVALPPALHQSIATQGEHNPMPLTGYQEWGCALILSLSGGRTSSK